SILLGRQAAYAGDTGTSAAGPGESSTRPSSQPRVPHSAGSSTDSGASLTGSCPGSAGPASSSPGSSPGSSPPPPQGSISLSHDAKSSSASFGRTTGTRSSNPWGISSLLSSPWGFAS